MTTFDRSRYLQPSGFRISEEAVDGWGIVRLRELTAGQLVFLSGVNGAEQSEAGRIYSKVIAMSLVDETDQLLFDHSNEGDIESLQNSKSWSSLERLAQRIIEFNGFGTSDVEAREKNSETALAK